MIRPDPRPAVRPALQARSRKTQVSLLEALDRLLRDRPFESITVQELARAANVSTGAFYARFASKEDLLPALYARFQESLEDRTERELDPSNWGSLSKERRLERLARFLCETYENRPWLLRAVVIHSRRRYSPDASIDAPTTAQVKWLRRLADCFDAAPSPWRGVTREQLEFALYTAITLTREAILFPHLPMAMSLDVNAASMRKRLPELVRRLLKGTTR